MRWPTTLRSTLRSTSLSLLVAGGLLTVACGEDGSGAETGEQPSTAGESSGGEGSDSGEPTTTAPSTGSDPTGEPGTSSGPDPDTGDTGEPDTTGEPEPTLQEQLEGHWVSEVCEPIPQADGSVLYFIRDFSLGVGTWSIVGTIHGDDACSFPLLTLEIGGGYELVGPAAGIDGAHEANFDRSSIALTPHVEDFVTWFDAAGCGSEAWAIGVGQDVTEGGCAFIPSAGACPVEYDLVALEGTDRLFLGERPVEGDMCSPRARPAALGEFAVARQGG